MRSSKSQNLGTLLGADKGTAVKRLTIYIPSKDKLGKKIRQRGWVLEALTLMTEINGGATVMPSVEAWSVDEKLVKESPVIVYSNIDAKKFKQNAAKIRAFLHRMGRETNQAAVGFEFDDRFYSIDKYDAED